MTHCAHLFTSYLCCIWGAKVEFSKWSKEPKVVTDRPWQSKCAIPVLNHLCSPGQKLSVIFHCPRDRSLTAIFRLISQQFLTQNLCPKHKNIQQSLIYSLQALAISSLGKCFSSCRTWYQYFLLWTIPLTLEIQGEHP